MILSLKLGILVSTTLLVKFKFTFLKGAKFAARQQRHRRRVH